MERAGDFTLAIEGLTTKGTAKVRAEVESHTKSPHILIFLLY